MTIYHNHHIIPRHMGGTDDPSNIIRISIEEHALAHKELYEKYGLWQDRVAWLCLSGQITNAEANLEAMREGARSLRGKVRRSQEFKDNLSRQRKGKKRDNFETWNRGKVFDKEFTKAHKYGRKKGCEVWNTSSWSLNGEVIKNLKEYCRNHNLNYNKTRGVAIKL